MGSDEKKPWYKKPLVLVSISAGAVGLVGLGYYVYSKYRNNQTERSSAKSEESFDSESGSQAPKLPAPDYSSTIPTLPVSTGFPIQKGSRGEYVRNLQNALINKYGASILPKWGADGVWGSELTKALTEKGLKTVIDNATYQNYITGNFGGSSSSTTSAPKTTGSSSIVTDVIKSVIPSWVTDPYIKIGFQLFDAAKAKNISATLSLLAKLKNTNDYSSASQGFQMRPYEPPFRTYTLVTGLLDAFKGSADGKAKIRAEFRRMGLKEHVTNSDPANYESTWTLSGLGATNKNVRTTMKAIITDGFNIRVEIPAKTIVGRWVSSGNGYTRFRTFDGRAMYVRTNAVVLVD